MPIVFDLLFFLLSFLTLLHSPPASVPTETASISVPTEGYFGGTSNQLRPGHWNHKFQDPQSTVLKNSHPKQLEGSPGEEQGSPILQEHLGSAAARGVYALTTHFLNEIR